MSEVLLPDIEAEWKKPPAPWSAPPVMMSLGIVEGEILVYLEERGATTLRRLIRELLWPAPFVTMAVGALIRGGFVRLIPHDLEVVVEAQAAHPYAAPWKADAVPEV